MQPPPLRQSLLTLRLIATKRALRLAVQAELAALTETTYAPPMTLQQAKAKFRERGERLTKNPPANRPPPPMPAMTAEDREAERQAQLANDNKP